MAEYYLLKRESLPGFLTFLTPEQQQRAMTGELLVAGAVEDAIAVGAAGLLKKEEEMWLESVAVSPDYQHRGIASGLLQYLCEVLPLLDCDRLVTELAPGLGEESPAGRLLRRGSWQCEQGLEIASCPVSALMSSHLMSPLLGRRASGILPLNEIPSASLWKFQKKLQSKGIVDLSRDWESFDPNLSFCGLNGEQEIICCLCTLRQVQDISIEWIYATKAGTKQLALTIAAALSAAKNQLSPDARISAVMLNSKGTDLLNHLAGDAVTYSYATHWSKDLLADL